MADLPTHRQFFGDAERDFRLNADLVTELERKTGAGIGGLSRRMFAGEFAHHELLEVVRLGLIGGGESPAVSASLVAVYAAPLPVMELYALALPVIETVMFGSVQKEGAE
ncbi:gene transfer agent family protein [Aquibium sp. LZ166]|uniref:Gene transfer agent family protein n=1 Tax=Aquibium pacificus TaxID=3153579 RepID=A0ABV3SBD8_9HYPH